MASFYFSLQENDGRVLCLSPLTNRLKEISDQDITDTSGYFLYEKKIEGSFSYIKILAQVFTDEAALTLKNALGMA